MNASIQSMIAPPLKSDFATSLRYRSPVRDLLLGRQDKLVDLPGLARLEPTLVLHTEASAQHPMMSAFEDNQALPRKCVGKTRS